MTMLRGCDSPFDIASHGAALRRRGIDFVMRRYSRDPNRNLDAREARGLSGAGLRIGTLWESGASLDGLSRRQGLLDGAEVLLLARAAGQPPGSAIYFGVSAHAARGDLDGVLRNYLMGVRMALGGIDGYRVGVHSSQARCAGLVDRGLAAFSWLAQAALDAGSARHALLQWPAARIVLDGAELRLSPVLGQPDCDTGLFRLAGRSLALGIVRH